jgi:hypothetical protein
VVILRAWHSKAAVDRDIAASKAKGTVYKIDQDANRRPGQEGAEIFGIVILYASGRQNAREVLGCDL